MAPRGKKGFGARRLMMRFCRTDQVRCDCGRVLDINGACPTHGFDGPPDETAIPADVAGQSGGAEVFAESEEEQEE